MGSHTPPEVTTTKSSPPTSMLAKTALPLLVSSSQARPQDFSHMANSVMDRAGQVVSSLWADYTTAPYTVVSELGDGVEERLYPAMAWVCDQKTVPMFTESQRRREGLFWPLFQYIQGANAASEIIPMTTPVTTLVTSEGDTITMEIASSWEVGLALHLLQMTRYTFVPR